ncbi:MAG: 4-hydroxy-3-methylbut-2-enyl diphosphate reductase, partial [Tidjanibacter sp.]|nr:4-hydroxy-3-methylbut-2-enyl diphosphate reductase [Tidjanibacter sp.]
MRVEIDEKSGFCYGVVGAISKADELVAKGRRVFSLGDIVHNDL